LTKPLDIVKNDKKNDCSVIRNNEIENNKPTTLTGIDSL